ncbi:hypothetical protein PAHAL_3G107200 [Panicum hallii]|uniref:Uncharacterized protein n=1 Tax=Panicum hallii TaxID=206008 RepID=A0A2T8KHS5_9POAL|nr:hypothetical protein PAHAL_3G107200 [Panicum hallii]
MRPLRTPRRRTAVPPRFNPGTPWRWSPTSPACAGPTTQPSSWRAAPSPAATPSSTTPSSSLRARTARSGRSCRRGSSARARHRVGLPPRGWRPWSTTRSLTTPGGSGSISAARTGTGRSGCASRSRGRSWSSTPPTSDPTSSGSTAPFEALRRRHVVAKTFWKNNLLVEYTVSNSDGTALPEEIVDVKHVRRCPPQA